MLTTLHAAMERHGARCDRCCAGRECLLAEEARKAWDAQDDAQLAYADATREAERYLDALMREP